MLNDGHGHLILCHGIQSPFLSPIFRNTLLSRVHNSLLLGGVVFFTVWSPLMVLWPLTVLWLPSFNPVHYNIASMFFQFWIVWREIWDRGFRGWRRDMAAMLAVPAVGVVRAQQDGWLASPKNVASSRVSVLVSWQLVAGLLLERGLLEWIQRPGVGWGVRLVYLSSGWWRYRVLDQVE